MGRREPRARREFTPDFRREAVELMNQRLAGGETLAQIGRDLELEPDMLRKWARDLGKWKEPGAPVEVDAAKRTEAEKDLEIKKLRRELETLRQERDFLKKATAFFAKESQ
jgi:transposase